MTNLRKIRLAHDMNQGEVAKVLGITKASYSRLESGKTRLNQDAIIRLVQFFNVTSDYLLGITHPESGMMNDLMKTLMDSGKSKDEVKPILRALIELYK